jgi:hypothetical protein
MTLRFIALLAFAGLGSLRGASDVHAKQFAIYYSFDHAPLLLLVSTIQEEFGRVMAPANIDVAWREINKQNGGDYADIYVVRFRGDCSIMPPGESKAAVTSAERGLGETSITDGHVLPFAEVRCDVLRRYVSIGPRESSDAISIMGRAIARITAHEIYHMMTGSVRHCGSGIAQAEYSTRDLTAAQFAFGAPEITRMKEKASGRGEAYAPKAEFPGPRPAL